jgi:3',5'-cyclic AMP phosphodiesterase CpdA
MKKLVLLLLILLPFGGCKSGSEHTGATDVVVEEPFFFIQMSDPQLGFANYNKDFDYETRNMERAIAVVNRLRPDFVVITGDLVNSYNNTAQLDEFARLLTLFSASIPVYLIPGNHDIKKLETGDELSPYIKRYGYDRFSFEHKGARFIGIDSNPIKESFAPLRSAQDSWLEGELSATSANAPIFVFTHHPPFIHSIKESDTYSTFSRADREKYMALFAKYGVNAVFAGHVHNHSSGEAKGVEVITAGPITKPLGTEGFSGMNLVKIWPGGFSSEFIALDKFPASVEF